MIRKGCYEGTSPRLGRCGGNSPMLTKCNCLAGSRVQPAPTRCWGGLGSYGLRQEPAPERGGFKSPELVLTRPGARRIKNENIYRLRLRLDTIKAIKKIKVNILRALIKLSLS